MDRMGLSAGAWQVDGAATMALRRNHDVDVEVTIRDMSDQLKGVVSFAGDAQVDVDANAPVNAALSATLLDRDQVLSRVGMNRQVKVTYSFYIAELDRVVSRTVFSGPLVRPPNRYGDEVAVECQDRAAIAMRGVPPKTYPAGRTVATIERILREKCGQTKFDFPANHQARLDDPITVGWAEEDRPWVQCQEAAASVDMQLFYDGPVCVLRHLPSTPVMDLTEFITQRHPAEAPSEIINRVKVVGKRPKDHTVVLDLPPKHDFSPQNLNVNGEPQFFSVTETNSKLNTVGKVRDRAHRLLERYEDALSEERGYDLVPVPNLHPLDLVEDGTNRYRVRSMSFPVTASGDMTIGYTRPLGRR